MKTSQKEREQNSMLVQARRFGTLYLRFKKRTVDMKITISAALREAMLLWLDKNKNKN